MGRARVLLVVAIFFSLLAFHNLDLSYNLVRLGYDSYDVSLGGVRMDVDGCHLTGLRFLFVSVLLVMVCLVLNL